MAINFVTMAAKGFQFGIDQNSAESQIKDGFVEDARNVDFTTDGYIRKRKGYKVAHGEVPIPVLLVSQSSTSPTGLPASATGYVRFILPDNIDLYDNHHREPVYVNVSLPRSTGDFSVLYEQSYPQSYALDLIQAADGSGNISFGRTGTTSTLSTPYNLYGDVGEFIVLVYKWNVNTGKPTELVTDCVVAVNTGSTTVTVSNLTPLEVYKIVVVDVSKYGGYTETVRSTNTTHTLTATTHKITGNIIVIPFYYSGTTLYQVGPTQAPAGAVSSFTIDSQNNVSITFGTTRQMMFVVLPADSTEITKDSSGSFIGSLTTDFPVIQEKLTSTNEVVISSNLDVAIDTLTKEATVVFSTLSGAKKFCYTSIRPYVRSIYVEAKGADNFGNDDLHMFIYGLSPEAVYNYGSTSPVLGKYVNTLTEYPLILSNNQLFSPETRTTYTSFVSKLNLVVGNTSRTLAPAFIDDGDTPNRWRKQYSLNGVSSGSVRGTSIVYNSGTGYVDYTITASSITEVGSGSDAILTTGLDFLTTTEASNSIHNGTFRVRGVSLSGGNTLIISVENPQITKYVSDGYIDVTAFDEAESGVLCGVFTDQPHAPTQDPNWASPTYPLPGDILESNEEIFVVSYTYTSNTVVLGGITEAIDITAGSSLNFIRENTKLVPLNLSATSSIPAGTIVDSTYGELKIVEAGLLNNTTGYISGTISDDGETCTVTVAEADMLYFKEGVSYIMATASETSTISGVDSRVITIDSITSSTTFTVNSSTKIISGSIRILMSVATIDLEIDLNSSVEFTWNTYWKVRFTPPTDTFAQVLPNYSRKLSNLTTLNTTADTISFPVGTSTLFLTNTEYPYKFDGASVYSAGLPKWQSTGLVFRKGLGGTSPIPATVSISTTTPAGAVSTTRLKTSTAGDKGALAVNDLIEIGNATPPVYRTIVNITDEGGGTDLQFLDVDVAFTGTAGSITVQKVYIYKYYARFSYIDINNNITISAPGNIDDLTVYRTSTDQCQIKFIAYPPIGFRDYDRLFIEIYRTAANGNIPYLVEKANLTTGNINGGAYYRYVEKTYDDTLISAEVLPAWDGDTQKTKLVPPPITNTGVALADSLVLANFAEPQNVEIQLVPTGSITSSGFISNAAGKAFKIASANAGVTYYYQFSNSYRAASFITQAAGTPNQLRFQVAGFPFTPTTNTYLYLFIDITSTTASTNDDEHTKLCGWFRVANYSGGVFTIYLPELITGTPTIAINVCHSIASSSVADPAEFVVPVPIFNSTEDYGMTSLLQSEYLGLSSVLSRTMHRLSMAINASISARSVLAADSAVDLNYFQAYSGNNYLEEGFIRIETQLDDLVVTLPQGLTNISFFANGIQRTATEAVSTRARLFPNRIASSVKNFPEVFNDCYIPETAAVFPDEVMDINPTDGQYITGIIPSFGDSVSGNARLDTPLVVFKNESVYLVNLPTKEQLKLDTGNIGCTAPRSIANTRNGVMFANHTGVYRLGSDRKVYWVGKTINRIWTEAVDRTRLSEAIGVHDASTRSYRLSVYFTDGNRYVLTYFYDNELNDVGPGAWTVYSGINAEGWAQFSDASYFCTLSGQVYQIREDNQIWDYRDDTESISAYVTLKAEGFGDTGIRKVLKGFRLHFRNYEDMDNTTVYSAIDLRKDFVEVDTFKIDLPYANTYLSDQESRKVDIIKFVTSTRKFTFVQVKVENDGLDEPMELVQVDYRVGGLSDEGVAEAAETTR